MACAGPGGVPMPCDGWGIYNSYVTDPLYQTYVTIGWTVFTGFVFMLALPSIVVYVRSGRWKEDGIMHRMGIQEDASRRGYRPLQPETASSQSSYFLSKGTKQGSNRSSDQIRNGKQSQSHRIYLYFQSALSSLLLTTPQLPFTKFFLPFSLSTFLLVLCIPTLILLTVLPESQLRANPNRFGFIALACVPPMFLLGSKSGPIGWLLGKSWTTVNFLHRWLGRSMVLLVLLHFYFWTIQWITATPISVFLSSPKETRGLLALCFLLLIAVSSARPFRKFSYPIFFLLHYIGIVGFIVSINMHTVYAQGWATWAVVGIYGVDIVGRLMGMRIKYVEIEAMEGGVTRVAIRGVKSGWRAGQHISLRIFFHPPLGSIWSSFRFLESHPFTISNSPSSIGILNSSNATPSSSRAERGIELFIKSCGSSTWTGDLHETALLGNRVAKARQERDGTGGGGGRKMYLHMLAMVEGPYGGLGEYKSLEQESVLLVAGGSGMSFVMGCLDEILGRRRKEGKGGNVIVVWAVKDIDQIIPYLTPLHQLLSLSHPSLSLSLHLHLTSPSATLPPSPSLPSTQIHLARPSFTPLLQSTISPLLAPCASCHPICHCGEINNDGMCANDEEECVGSGAASARELLEFEEGYEIAELESGVVSLAGREEKGCCAVEKKTEKEEKEGGGCCGGGEKGLERKEGKGCCTTRTSVKVRGAPDPIKLRTGGLGIVVCGPKGMISGMRNAASKVPIATQVRIGGIEFHEEHFSL